MLDILKFVFTNFWTFIGTFLLILAIGHSINAIVIGFKGRKSEIL